jgi:hypothetical protein
LIGLRKRTVQLLSGLPRGGHAPLKKVQLLLCLGHRVAGIVGKTVVLLGAFVETDRVCQGLYVFLRDGDFRRAQQIPLSVLIGDPKPFL